MESLKTCPLCDRVYTQESRYLRHVRYCRRAKDQRKGRPKSCVACNASKVKCSFSAPCARCEKKGLRCVYGDRRSREGEADQASFDQNDIPAFAVDEGDRGSASSLALISNQDGRAQGQDVDAIPWVDDGWLEFATSGDLDLPVNFGGDLTSDGGSFQLHGFDGIDGHQTQDALDPLSSITHYSTPQTSDATSSCDRSMSRGQLQRRLTGISKDLTSLRHGNPVLKHAASLIMHIVCAFPQMMLRRQTFPPFIHPRWHEPRLPEKISSCMGIAQLFAARTPETRGFLWRMISAEEQRFQDEFMTLSVYELQHAMQAMMIYIIMAVVDRDADTPRRGMQLIQTAGLLAWRFRQLLPGEYYSMTEQARPSSTWEDWIFAESRRRLTCLWHTVSCVVALDDEIPCEGCPPIDSLPLVSGAPVWQARTEEEWRAEKSLHDSGHPLVTLGDLKRCRKGSSSRSLAYGTPAVGDQATSQARLMNWEATGDKLAVMMNIVTAFT